MTSFAVVPAAGLSQRMGEPKLLLPWRSERVIDAVLHIWSASVDQVVVVVRADDKRLAEACCEHDIHLVQPVIAPPTMKDSIKVAVDWINANFSPLATDSWLLAPADQPRLSGEVIAGLLAAHERNPKSVKLPIVDGRRGHPVLFPWSAVDRLPSIPADKGVNALLDQLAVERLSFDHQEILDDLDTPDDYRRLIREDGKSEQA